MYAKASTLYAFSGTLTSLEADCIRSAFEANIINYPLLNSLKPYQNVLIKRKEITEKINWWTALTLEVEKWCKKVPIIVLIQSK